jgi:hypothetical protein
VIIKTEPVAEIITIINKITEPRAAAFSSDSNKLYVLDGIGAIVVLQ